jgi:proteasome lid subunit RPN8/RPN11
MANEKGYLICKVNGKLSPGPTHNGEAHNVDIPVGHCQRPNREALVHNHPGGNIRLSEQDVKAAVQHGVKHVCVVTAKKTQCYRIIKK